MVGACSTLPWLNTKLIHASRWAGSVRGETVTRNDEVTHTTWRRPLDSCLFVRPGYVTDIRNEDGRPKSPNYLYSPTSTVDVTLVTFGWFGFCSGSLILVVVLACHRQWQRNKQFYGRLDDDRPILPIYFLTGSLCRAKGYTMTEEALRWFLFAKFPLALFFIPCHGLACFTTTWYERFMVTI